jgi:hypothetical protein
VKSLLSMRVKATLRICDSRHIVRDERVGAQKRRGELLLGGQARYFRAESLCSIFFLRENKGLQSTV